MLFFRTFAEFALSRIAAFLIFSISTATFQSANPPRSLQRLMGFSFKPDGFFLQGG